MAGYKPAVMRIIEDHNEESWDQKMKNFRANVKTIINQISANNVELERLQKANEDLRLRLSNMDEPERKDFIVE
jgi:chromosome segregation ATPase